MVCGHAEAEADADTFPDLRIDLSINFDPNGQVIYS